MIVRTLLVAVRAIAAGLCIAVALPPGGWALPGGWWPLAFVGVALWWRKRLFETRWYLFLASHAWWLGFVAVIAGWTVTETGRQPWVATGILRTADAAAAQRGINGNVQ